MKRSIQSRPVYRTDGGRLCPKCQHPIGACICGQDEPKSIGDGFARIRKESKGRGGKIVTVIDGLSEEQKKMKELCKQLKRKCGAGGAVKGYVIEIQGDKRNICKSLLEDLGYCAKLSGP